MASYIFLYEGILLKAVKNHVKPNFLYGTRHLRAFGNNAEEREVDLKPRFLYPEFLPDPTPKYRNFIREKLERADMLARRGNVEIPEFYVGSIVAVTISDPHALGKQSRFLGICIHRSGAGLRASFILRNVIDHQGVEVNYDVYDPTILKIECLRREKRLDNELFYLRDAPPEYSTFPVDMESEYYVEGSPVPVNDIKVPLKPLPWLVKWERFDMKGLQDMKHLLKEKRLRKAANNPEVKPWEKYDLMKTYRQTIPEQEQRNIYAEVMSELHRLELLQQKMKRSRTFIKPKKSG